MVIRHIRNLDKENLGIDVNNDFRPTYKILPDKKKQIKALQDKMTFPDSFVNYCHPSLSQLILLMLSNDPLVRPSADELLHLQFKAFK